MPVNSYPEEFVSRIEAQLGAESGEFLQALGAPPEGLRTNTLRLGPERLRRDAGFRLDPLTFPPEGFLIAEGGRAGKHPYHAAGLYYIQDPGAIAAGALVAAQPGERVLDLAAAPGGKATHLAAQMQNEGVLIANDVSRPRARELVRNLERCGVRNAIILSETAERLAGHFGPYFDRVLLDAPCSGESMFHKSAAAREDWSPAAVGGCARRQTGLLQMAAKLTRPGGVLVYSTCTFGLEENEEVVSGFLSAHPHFSLEPLGSFRGLEEVEPGVYRLWPHRIPGAGHFIAALRRDHDGAGAVVGRWEPTPPPDALRYFGRFRQDVFPALPVDPARLALLGRELYELPAHPPAVKGLRVLRPGFWLGTVQRDRFEPGHALALAVGPDLSPATADLRLEDERVGRYLRGHPIDHAGPPGWMPVAVDGFALGWGKRVGATVKNHYPKGLRLRG